MEMKTLGGLKTMAHWTTNRGAGLGKGRTAVALALVLAGPFTCHPFLKSLVFSNLSAVKAGQRLGRDAGGGDLHPQRRTKPSKRAVTPGLGLRLTQPAW